MISIIIFSTKPVWKKASDKCPPDTSQMPKSCVAATALHAIFMSPVEAYVTGVYTYAPLTMHSPPATGNEHCCDCGHSNLCQKCYEFLLGTRERY